MLNFNKLLISAAVLTLLSISCSKKKVSIRIKENFNKNWKFSLVDTADAKNAEFIDSSWRTLNLPHDWSVEGQFDEKNPSTTGGGALPGGIGWYRKSFSLDTSYQNKLVYIEFDGVYLRSEVWINGHYLGKRPYGYISFRYNLSPYLNFGEKKNVIAVKVDNSQQSNSRWYSGSGIYRNVWLIATGKVAVAHWGTYITTPEVSEQQAKVSLKTKIENNSGKEQNATVLVKLIDNKGNTVATDSKEFALKDSITEVAQEFLLAAPKLWSVENPNLYKALVQILVNAKPTDDYETSFGVRSFEFDTVKGFLLNGKQLKINGVCNHHDLGCLGSAINTRGLERQLELLKAMGCNGIRTSHNPPAPELLDLCDRMGFIIMDEAFDMWKKGKNKYDYSLDWDAWHKRDLEDFVTRDRNHPSVFIWSIGNEIPEQWDTSGITIAKELAGIVRNLDPTRPITSACNDPQPYNNIIKSGALDLIGFNYHHQDFEKFGKTFPGKKFIATESVSGLASRGCYDMPSDTIRRWPIRWDLPFTTGNKDLTCSSYDNCSAPWGSTHEETWKVMKKHDYLSGMFIWTGFDYIGEPTPYPWPAKSSYFGILDLCGFPKDVYYMYQSEWTNTPVLHIFPHWNWEKGDTVDVWAYTNADEVELFLNGKSLGTQKKVGDVLHLKWNTIFEPGTLLAIAKKEGKEFARKEVKTAEKAAKIVLEADRSRINADGFDLSYITIKVTDANGIMVPKADNLIKFKVEGAGTIAGVDNGCQTSLEPFKANQRKAFNGMCLLVVQAAEKSGNIKITASSEGLQNSEIKVIVK